jgi:Ribbon-helix-helix protein, copG family
MAPPSIRRSRRAWRGRTLFAEGAALGVRRSPKDTRNGARSVSPVPRAAIRTSRNSIVSLIIYVCLYKLMAMVRRRLTSFAIDSDLAAALKLVKERDGVNESEQIRRALREWLEDKGALKKTDRKRATTRKQSQ